MKKISKEEWIKRFKLKYGNKFDYSKVKEIDNQYSKITIICNKHKTEFEQIVSVHYRSKYGCPLCEAERKKKKYYTTETFLQSLPDSLKKYDYDYSLVNYTGIYNLVEVICKKHGKFQISATKLLRGHKCNLCALEDNANTFKLTTEEFIKKCKERFGDRYDYSRTVYGKNAKDEIIIGCPNCGFFKTSPLNFYYSEQGCACMRNKYMGEEKIKIFLEQNNISYIRNKGFPDLKDKKALSYDFYLSKQNILIEYNGSQHYSQKSFNRTRKEFLIQKHHDWLKRKYCLKNKIKLITIPYWKYKNIESILKEELNDY